MTKHQKYPYRKVVSAELSNDQFGRAWQVNLECGHFDISRVRYSQERKLGRGGARKTAVRSLEDILPHPEKVRCADCGLRT